MRSLKFTVLSFSLLLLFSFFAKSAGLPVPKWGRFETAITNTNNYVDSYRDVTLNVTYTKPDATTVGFWGFYDGDGTWRIRFMPDQVGTWTYAASFSDGSGGETNTFECVEGDLPGLITADEENPMWFGYKGGKHTLIRSFHCGDRFFASNWAATNRTTFLDWAQAQGYNMFAIGSMFFNRNEAGRGLGWNTPDLWDGPTRSLHASEYQKLEAILDDLTARRILVFPFSGFFGKSSDFPTNHADQELYLRYTLARVAPNWNLVFNVAGPEPLLPSDVSKYQYAMTTNDITRLANLIKTLDPFGHLISEHNTPDANAFSNQTWEAYTTLQGPKTTNRTILNTNLLARHQNKPQYGLEVLWPGNQVGHPVYNDTDIRKNGFVMMLSATALNFGDMTSNSSSGFSGSMEMVDKIQSRHDIIKKVWDFFETEPFWRMKPHQELVNNGWCLAEPGREYLVYLQSTGSVSITVSNGPFKVEWINGQNTSDRRAVADTTNGQNLRSPTDGDDWFVHLETHFEAWRSSYFTNALDSQSSLSDTADPDGDGIQNLAEYFFATDPTIPDVGGNAPSVIQTNDSLRFQYVRRQTNTLLNLTCQFSSDLLNWRAGIQGIDYDDPTTILNTNGTKTVSFRLLQAGPTHFVRATTSLANPAAILETWRTNQFKLAVTNTSISGNNADPDHDGIKNVAEFYYALDPNVSDASSPHLPAIIADSPGARLQFTRRQDPGTAVLTCEFSTDLQQWHSGTYGVDYDDLITVPNSDGTETISLRLISAETINYVRLLTTLAP